MATGALMWWTCSSPSPVLLRNVSRESSFNTFAIKTEPTLRKWSKSPLKRAAVCRF